MEALMNSFVAVFAGECAQEEVDSMKELLRIQEDEILEVFTQNRKLQAKYDELVAQRQSELLEQDAVWKADKEVDEHVQYLENEVEELQLSKENLLEDLFAERRCWAKEKAYYKGKLEEKDLELTAALEREEVWREKFQSATGENYSQRSSEDVQTVLKLALEAKSQYETLEKQLEEKNFELIDTQRDIEELELELDDYKTYWQERGADLEKENINLHAKVQFLADSVKSCQLDNTLNVKKLSEDKKLVEKLQLDVYYKDNLINILNKDLTAAMKQKEEADSVQILEENSQEDILSGSLFDNVDFSGFTTFFH